MRNNYLRKLVPIIIRFWPYLLLILLVSIFMSRYASILNNDAIAYISITKHYLNGDILQAINGTWSPLISWLMAPFIYLGVDEIVSFRIVSILTGLGLLCILGRLAGQYIKTNRLVQYFLLISSIAISAYILSSPVAPDLLTVFFFTLYVYLLTRKPNISDQTLKGAIGIGLVVGLGYLSRSYFLPFAVLHLSLVFGYELIRNRKKLRKKFITISRNYVIIGLTLIIIMGPWIVALYKKYDQVTFSTSGAYNYSLVSPQRVKDPLNFELQRSVSGLRQPPSEKALTLHEDLSFIRLESWTPFESWSNLIHQGKLILKNSIATKDVLLSFSVFSFGILLLTTLMLTKKNSDLSRFKWFSLSALTIYAIGYILVLLEPRYIWNFYYFLILYFFILIDKQRINSKHTGFKVASIIVVLSFLPTLWTDLVKAYQLHSFERDSVESLIENVQMDGRIASNSKRTRIEGRYIAFLTGNQYYDHVRDPLEEERNIAQLQRYKIKYYLIDDKDALLENFNDCREAGRGFNFRVVDISDQCYLD